MTKSTEVKHHWDDLPLLRLPTPENHKPSLEYLGEHLTSDSKHPITEVQELFRKTMEHISRAGKNKPLVKQHMIRAVCELLQGELEATILLHQYVYHVFNIVRSRLHLHQQSTSIDNTTHKEGTFFEPNLIDIDSAEMVGFLFRFFKENDSKKRLFASWKDFTENDLRFLKKSLHSDNESVKTNAKTFSAYYWAYKSHYIAEDALRVIGKKLSARKKFDLRFQDKLTISQFTPLLAATIPKLEVLYKTLLKDFSWDEKKILTIQDTAAFHYSASVYRDVLAAKKVGYFAKQQELFSLFAPHLTNIDGLDHLLPKQPQLPLDPSLFEETKKKKGKKAVKPPPPPPPPSPERTDPPPCPTPPPIEENLSPITETQEALIHILRGGPNETYHSRVKRWLTLPNSQLERIRQFTDNGQPAYAECKDLRRAFARHAFGSFECIRKIDSLKQSYCFETDKGYGMWGELSYGNEKPLVGCFIFGYSDEGDIIHRYFETKSSNELKNTPLRDMATIPADTLRKYRNGDSFEADCDSETILWENSTVKLCPTSGKLSIYDGKRGIYAAIIPIRGY